MTKNDEVARGSKVADDEPIFVLRARDRLAPDIVRDWAEYAITAGVNREKIDEAFAIAICYGRMASKKWSEASGLSANGWR